MGVVQCYCVTWGDWLLLISFVGEPLLILWDYIQCGRLTSAFAPLVRCPTRYKYCWLGSQLVLEYHKVLAPFFILS